MRQTLVVLGKRKVQWKISMTPDRVGPGFLFFRAMDKTAFGNFLALRYRVGPVPGKPDVFKVEELRKEKPNRFSCFRKNQPGVAGPIAASGSGSWRWEVAPTIGPWFLTPRFSVKITRMLIIMGSGSSGRLPSPNIRVPLWIIMARPGDLLFLAFGVYSAFAKAKKSSKSCWLNDRRGRSGSQLFCQSA